MSSSSQHARPRHKTVLGNSRSLRVHQSHDSLGKHQAPRRQEAESSAIMVAAGRKADAQREDKLETPRTEPAPQRLAPSVVSPSVTLFTTAFGLVSIPPTLLSSASAPTPLSESTQQKQAFSQSLALVASAQSTTSSISASVSVSASPSSATHFPPALLAFILIFACLFFVVMLLALLRMCRRKRARAQLASPLVFGNVTALGWDRHRSEAMELDKQSMMARTTEVRFDQSQPGYSVESGNTGNMAQETSLSARTDTPNAPLPAHVAASAQSTRSRVLQPYVPRPYHRPHPTRTEDREAVMPLMAAEGFQNGNNHTVRNKGKGAHSRAREGGKGKGKGKENITQDKTSDHGKRHRNSHLARSMERPPNPLSSALNSGTGTRQEVSSPSSVSDMPGVYVPESAVVPPRPATGTIAVDIGLAMLTEFSSPNIGIGFDPPSISGSPLASHHSGSCPTADHLSASSSVIAMSRGASPHLVQSASSGSKGLAYLSSESSNSLMSTGMEERDVTEESLPDQELDPRAQAHARLVEQLNLAIDPDVNIPTAPAVSFKAPFLPTLSEMALYRADPLYESVTNELFASYGVRMSTSSGMGRMSRVSARISQMLSWFGDAAPGERLSVGERSSGESEWLSGEGDRVFGVAGGGVQPLRVNGKLLRTSSGPG